MKHRFKYSTLTLTITALVFIVLGAGLYFIINDEGSLWFRIMMTSLIVFGIIQQTARTPISVSYDEQMVEIGMLVWRRRFYLHDYEVRVVTQPNLLLKSVRAFGSGGFLGYRGYFYNKEQGRFRLYCTDEKQTSFLELRNKKDGSLTYIAWQTES